MFLRSLSHPRVLRNREHNIFQGKDILSYCLCTSNANVSNRAYIDVRSGFVTMTSRGFLVGRSWTYAEREYQDETDVGEEMKRKMLRRKAKKREKSNGLFERRLVGVLVSFVNRISIGPCIKATIRAYSLTFTDAAVDRVRAHAMPFHQRGGNKNNTKYIFVLLKMSYYTCHIIITSTQNMRQNKKYSWFSNE